MSETVFLIAVVPALIVVAAGLISRNKVRTAWVAAAMGVVGVRAGSPVYMLIDAVCVAAAYLWVIGVIQKRNDRRALQIRERIVAEQALSRQPAARHAGWRPGRGTAVMIVTLAGAIWTWGGASRPAAQASRTGSEVSAPARKPQNSNERPRPARERDLRDCLALDGNAAISRCVSDAENTVRTVAPGRPTDVRQ